MRNNKTFKPGKRLEIPDRVKKRERQFREPLSSTRQSISEAASKIPIEPPNENITPNTFVGALGTFVVYALEDYLPVRSGANISITNVEEEGDGEYVYDIDVNAALEPQARFKAIMESGTGAISLWVDNFEVVDAKVIKERPARDTYSYRVKIREN